MLQFFKGTATDETELLLEDSATDRAEERTDAFDDADLLVVYFVAVPGISRASL